MKLFKFLPFLVLSISLLTFKIISGINIDNNQIDPISQKNNFLFQLNQSLNLAQMKYQNLSIRDFQNQAEFTIIKNDGQPSLVIFSTEKDAYWQVSSLQEILKTSKIKDKHVKFIDLSSQHPYATFQNN